MSVGLPVYTVVIDHQAGDARGTLELPFTRSEEPGSY